MEASLMARALGNLGRAQVQDKLEKDVRRWTEVGVGIVEARALQQIVHSRASSKRVVSGPYVGYRNVNIPTIQRALAMETAICSWTRSTVWTIFGSEKMSMILDLKNPTLEERTFLGAEMNKCMRKSTSGRIRIIILTNSTCVADELH